MIRLPWLAAIAMVAAALVPAAAGVDAANAPVVVGDVPSVVGAENIGDVDHAAPVRVQLVLRRQNEAALDALLSKPQRTPVSDSEMRSRFEPAPAAVSQSVAYLQSHGFANVTISADQTLVEADAPASALQAAFGTRLRLFHEKSTGKTFHSNVSAASLPASLAATVRAVHGLSDRPAARRAATAHDNTGPPGASGGYTPAELKALYNLHSGSLASTNGAGVTIGLMEFTNYSPAHVASYDTFYYPSPAAQPPPPIPVPVGTGPDPTCCGNQLESELDIEVIQAIAPKATIRVYEAPNNDAGQNAAYNMMVSDRVNVISTSWGLCEQQTSQSELATLDQIFQGAAAHGINVYAATGDSGAFDCRNPNDPNDAFNNPLYNTPAVDSPASDPNVVGVGGSTLFNTGDYLHYSRELAWSGSGGGLSSVYSKPSWQANTGIGSQARQVPDVAFDGDPNSGVSVYTYPGSATAFTDAGTWQVIGGTSVGAPAWAAFNALYDQYAAAASLATLGAAGPAFYDASQCPDASPPFHDVTTGDNGYYSAGNGYDLVSGLGTMDGALLAARLARTTPPPVRVKSITPTVGPTRGGTRVTIGGCGFGAPGGPRPTVTFGGVGASAVSVTSPYSLQATSPSHSPGSVDVAVASAGSSGTLSQAFLYADQAHHGTQRLVRQPTDGSLVTGGLGTDRGIYTRAQRGPGGVLSPWGATGGTFNSDPALVADTAGRIQMFALGSDGTLQRNRQSYAGGGWGGWASLGNPGVTLDGQPTVAPNQDGRLQVFVRGTDGSVYTRWETYGGGLSSWASFGGNVAGDPIPGPNGDGRLQLFVRGVDGALYTNWQTSINGAWSGWSYFGFSGLPGNPGAGPNQDGRLQIFVRGGDGALYSRWQKAINADWSDWASFGGSSLGGDPSTIPNQDGRLQLFERGGDGLIYSRWQKAINADWSDWGALTAQPLPMISDASPAMNLDGRAELVATGSDAALWDTPQYAPNGVWHAWTSLGGGLSP